MPTRPEPDDPAVLTPHERLCELAAILAQGVRQLRAYPTHGADSGQILPKSPRSVANSGQIPPDSPPTCLELSATSCPDGPVCKRNPRVES